MKVDKLKSFLTDPAHKELLDFIDQVENFHPELLPAYFNLLAKRFDGDALVIKSQSLKSLISFYNSLITNRNFEACEIIKSTSTYFGLLKGPNTKIDFPEDITHCWIRSTDQLKNIYQH